MPRSAFTLRIDAEERNALKNLSKIEGRPINQLLNEAIKSYLRRKTQRERGLEATLKNLEAYRKKDPEYKKAIAAFAAAEASIKDPLEGVPFDENGPESSSAPEGPVQSNMREVLGA
jgi:predicted transcriptional regulator